jgi:Ca2+-transporting ATPase
LLALVLLFVIASAFDINKGVVLTPSMVLYLLFFATAAGVIVIAVDAGDPDVMHRPPRDPKVPITNHAAILTWLLYASTLFIAALIPLVAGPDTPHPNAASASMTMTFAVMGLGTTFNALTNRRDPASGLNPPLLKALAISLFPIIMIVLATQLPVLQSGLLTQSLSGREWLACIGLALLLPLVVEGKKWLYRRAHPAPQSISVFQAVSPTDSRGDGAGRGGTAPASMNAGAG